MFNAGDPQRSKLALSCLQRHGWPLLDFRRMLNQIDLDLLFSPHHHLCNLQIGIRFKAFAVHAQGPGFSPWHFQARLESKPVEKTQSTIDQNTIPMLTLPAFQNTEFTKVNKYRAFLQFKLLEMLCYQERST